MKYLSTLIKSGIAVIATASVVFYSSGTLAAQRVVFAYRGFRQSLSVDELTTFAETGETSPSIRYYLNQTSEDPEVIRNVLTRQFSVTPVTLDRTLNSRIGQYLLDQISYSIRTPSGQASRQALRSALVLSASNGNQISLIEIIQNYPTSEVVVESDRIVRTYNQLSILAQDLQRIFGTNTSLR
ncbi:MAG: alpha/beta hydrolase [Calothrix sp. C42_A2020_038]|nr:alpha/beta hydrolase [Calothrix sp. C42_A2020_038]